MEYPAPADHQSTYEAHKRLWREFEAADPSVLKERGAQLIKDIEAAWDRGDTEFIIPPGCYDCPTPLPIKNGCLLEGNNLVYVRAPAQCVPYPYQSEQEARKDRWAGYSDGLLMSW